MEKTNSKFWNMSKHQTKNSAEITIYGEIGASWWGDSITPKQFSKDLKDLGDVNEITVRVNSGGGSVFDGLAIRSLLKNHNATVTVHVDGYAASIASIIAMAGDKIVMAKGSMMMIHNPATSLWGGESKDFREIADFLDKIRDSLVDVYVARTGKDAAEIIDMMNNETWMSAAEAVEMGFADEVEDSSPVTASMRGAVATINGVTMDFSHFLHPPRLPKAASDPRPSTAIPAAPLSSDPEEEEILNIQDLKNKHPELYAEVFNSGVTQERERLQALDDLAMPGNQAVINKAKYETMASAAETAIQILKADNKQRETYNQNARDDADGSGVNGVEAGTDGNEQNSASKKSDEAAAFMASIVNKQRGGVK